MTALLSEDSPNRINLDKHSSFTDRTHPSAYAFRFQSKNGELWSAPEQHRIRGDVLLHSGDAAEAQISCRRAIESAL